ncbi:MAG: LysM peptidoglycan-binding domain-containing protein [Nitrospirota bacterium]
MKNMHIKRTLSIVSLISILVISTSADSFGQSSEDNRNDLGKDGDETVYTIKKGDTLWDISGEFLKNPFMWPNLWENNNYINNPDLIYPGNRLIIPSVILLKTEPAEEAAPVSAAEATLPEQAVVPVPGEPITASIPSMPAHPKRPPLPGAPAVEKPVVSSDTIEASGYVINKIEGYGVISGSAEDRNIFADGDTVKLSLSKGYTDKVLLGGKFTIFRTSGPVIHPRTKKKAGFIFIPVGVLEINRVQGNDASGNIIRSYTYASPGDLIQPFSPAQPVNRVTKVADDLQGYIIEAQYGSELSAQFSIVYLDKGAADGITPGAIMYVIREKKDDIIGELRVVSVQDTTSTALVIRSVEPFGVGSKVITIK